MKFFCVALAMLLCSVAPTIAASPVAETAQDKSCKQFVQEFYNWYLKLCKSEDKKESPSDIALKAKKDSFDAVLAAKLNEDSVESSKYHDEIVGLDFDPFLAAQDMAENYKAEKVTVNGAKYRVEVFGTWNGKKNAKPDVKPELAFRSGRWVFTNFIYPASDKPSDSNLISVLDQLKKDRPPLKTAPVKSKKAK